MTSGRVCLDSPQESRRNRGMAHPAGKAEASLTRIPLQYLLPPAPPFPNSRLPVLVYRAVLESPEPAAFERVFKNNGWTGSWRNGLYTVHHYHSTAHEVLGMYRGSVRVRFGGEQGMLLELIAGDAVVIPAGVAHKNEHAAPDFAVVGAYPSGTGPDMMYGKPAERPEADRRILQLALPAADPLYGREGPLGKLWQSA
jgi:uncharacterized protein YjlB